MWVEGENVKLKVSCNYPVLGEREREEGDEEIPVLVFDLSSPECPPAWKLSNTSDYDKNSQKSL